MVEIDQEIAVGTTNIPKCILNLHYLTRLCILKIVVAHRNSRVIVSDNVGIFKANHTPWLQSEASVFTHYTANEIGKSFLLSEAKLNT